MRQCGHCWQYSYDSFNPHTPSGVRPFDVFLGKDIHQFQSTHPERGATVFEIVLSAVCVFQSTHPERGATTVSVLSSLEFLFQSTHPERGATTIAKLQVTNAIVSIHTPRAGCDMDVSNLSRYKRSFNPHTPSGVRLAPLCKKLLDVLFQSTHPERGATPGCPVLSFGNFCFNPHTPSGVRHYSLSKYNK